MQEEGFTVNIIEYLKKDKQRLQGALFLSLAVNLIQAFAVFLK